MIIDDQDALEPLREIKQKLEHELSGRSRKRKHDEDDNMFRAKKRNITDKGYGELTDFAIDLVNKLENDEEQIKNVMQLIIAKDEMVVNIWKSLISQSDENSRIKKFVTLVNFQFSMVSTPDIIFQMPADYK